MQIEDNSILVNVAQRPHFKNKGTFHNFMNSNRFCTLCHRSGHTIDFCYKRYRHPNFNKHNSDVNVSQLHSKERSRPVDEALMAFSTSKNDPIFED